MLAMVAEFEADLIRMRTREGMKVAKAKGRLRGKQPKLKRTRRSTCWSCTIQGAIPKVSSPSFSALADQRCTGPSSESDPSHQNHRGLSHISRILMRNRRLLTTAQRTVGAR